METVCWNRQIAMETVCWNRQIAMETVCWNRQQWNLPAGKDRKQWNERLKLDSRSAYVLLTARKIFLFRISMHLLVPVVTLTSGATYWEQVFSERTSGTKVTQLADNCYCERSDFNIQNYNFFCSFYRYNTWCPVLQELRSLGCWMVGC